MKTATLIVLSTLYKHCLATGFKHHHMIIAGELLNGGLPKGKDYTMKDIKQSVYKILDVEEKDVEVRSRKPECKVPRQLAMYFIYKYRKAAWSLAMIGNEVAGRDHATVLHSVKTVNNLCETEVCFRDKVNDIEYQLVKRYEL